MTIDFELDSFRQKSIPHLAELRRVIESLGRMNLERFLPEARKEEIQKVLRPATSAVMEFLRNYLSAEQAKINLIKGKMSRACEVPQDEFSKEDLRELRETLFKEGTEDERFDLVRRGLNGRAAFFHAANSDPAETMDMTGLRREYLQMKNPDLLEQEVEALNHFSMMKAMGNELSGTAARLIDDSGFPYPLSLGERWITAPKNDTEAMRRRFVEAPNRSKLTGIEPEVEDDNEE